MKLDFHALRSVGAALLLGALSVGSTGCGDDPAPAPPPPTYAPITGFNGITDQQVIQFKIGDAIVAGNSAYGNPTTIPQALVGSQTEVKVLTNDGIQLASAKVAIDSNRSVWVLAAGRSVAGSTPSIWGVSHEEPTAPAGRALVRMIHASVDAGKVDVHESDAFGANVATNLEYKGSSNFTSVSPAVNALSVTTAGTNTEILSIPVNPKLDSGKVYNIVLYGTTNPDAVESLKLTAKIVPEP